MTDFNKNCLVCIGGPIGMGPQGLAELSDWHRKGHPQTSQVQVSDLVITSPETITKQLKSAKSDTPSQVDTDNLTDKAANLKAWAENIWVAAHSGQDITEQVERLHEAVNDLLTDVIRSKLKHPFRDKRIEHGEESHKQSQDTASLPQSNQVDAVDELLMKVQGMTPSIDSVNAWAMRAEAKAKFNALLVAAEISGLEWTKKRPHGGQASYTEIVDRIQELSEELEKLREA